MSDIVQGVVVKTKASSGKTKKGAPWSKVALLLDDENWYGFFKNKTTGPVLDEVEQGDVVKVAYVENGEYLNGEKIKIVEKASTPPVKSSKGESVSSAKENNYQFRITRAGARNTAIKMVEMLLANDALWGKDPASTKKMGIIESKVAEYTDQFSADVWYAQPPVKAEEVEDGVEEDDDFEE